MNSLLRGVQSRALVSALAIGLPACEMLEDIVAEDPGESGGTAGTSTGGAPDAGSGGAGGTSAGGASGGASSGTGGSPGIGGAGGVGASGGAGGAGATSGSGGAGAGGAGAASGAGGIGPTGGNPGVAGGGAGGTGGTGGTGGMAGGAGGSAGTGGTPNVPCRITSPVFCESFGAPSPGGRAGDLDESRWSASRLALNVSTSTAGPYVGWFPTQSTNCSGASTTVQADNDLLVCPSGSRQGLHDALNVDSNFNREVNRTLMVRQPFDFGNRTGTIAFELASNGPVDVVEVWVTSAPLTGLAQSVAFPLNSLRVRLSSSGCPGNRARFTGTASSSELVTELTSLADIEPCVETGNDAFVHYQIRISRTQVEVFTLPPGASELARAAILSGNISVSRGYVHLVHSRVAPALETGGDRAEAPPAPRELRWGSVSFDGPTHSAGRNYDAPDSLTTPMGQGVPTGYINIGHRLFSAEPSGVVVDGVDLSGAPIATLHFNVYGNAGAPTPLFVRFNGGTQRTVTQAISSTTWQAISMSVPVSDLVNGRNTIEFISSMSLLILANVSLHLEQGAGGAG